MDRRGSGKAGWEERCGERGQHVAWPYGEWGEGRPPVAPSPSHSGQKASSIAHKAHRLSEVVLWCPFLSLTSCLTPFPFIASRTATLAPLLFLKQAGQVSTSGPLHLPCSLAEGFFGIISHIFSGPSTLMFYTTLPLF